MSYTEIYKFDKNGDASFLGQTENAWRGAMAIWRILKRKYLAPLSKPSWIDEADYLKRGYYRYQVPPPTDDNIPHPLQPVWDLFKDHRLFNDEKNVLGTTFDRVIVRRENILEIIGSFYTFSERNKTNNVNLSLKEQAEIIQHAITNDDDLIAIAWNQTSIGEAFWESYNIDENGENIPYNIFNDSEHQFLFKK